MQAGAVEQRIGAEIRGGGQPAVEEHGGSRHEGRRVVGIDVVHFENDAHRRRVRLAAAAAAGGMKSGMKCRRAPKNFRTVDARRQHVSMPGNGGDRGPGCRAVDQRRDHRLLSRGRDAESGETAGERNCAGVQSTDDAVRRGGEADVTVLHHERAAEFDRLSVADGCAALDAQLAAVDGNRVGWVGEQPARGAEDAFGVFLVEQKR